MSAQSFPGCREGNWSVLHEARELLAEGLSRLFMWRHSCEPEASARVMEAWPLRFKGQAAELDSTSGGAISRARDEPQAIPAHLGRSLKSLFWVRAWRNKSHLCWVYASVSPAHSGPQRLKTDPPSRLLSGSRHTRLSQPPGRSAGAQNWRLCPLGGFLPDSLRFHRISKTYNMTSSVQVPPHPANFPGNRETVTRPTVRGQRRGVWPLYTFTNSAWEGRCKKDTPTLYPKAPLFQHLYSLSQSWAGRAESNGGKKAGAEGARRAACRGGRGKRRAALLSCRGSSSPKFPGSRPRPARPRPAWSRAPGWTPCIGPSRSSPPSLRGDLRKLPFLGTWGKPTGVPRRTDAARNRPLNSGCGLGSVHKGKGCAPLDFLLLHTPPLTATPHLCIYKEGSGGPCGWKGI